MAALACDLLDEEGPLKVLFRSDSFLNFIREILNVPSLHRNIDPVGAVFVNIYQVGGGRGEIVQTTVRTVTFTTGTLTSPTGPPRSYCSRRTEEDTSDTLNPSGDWLQPQAPLITDIPRNESDESLTYPKAERVLEEKDDGLTNTLDFQPGKTPLNKTSL